MTDHPIIFSAPMVRALLDGRKTMTRRLNEGVWANLHADFNYREIDGYPDYLAGRDGVIYSRKRGFAALKATPTSRGYPSVSLCGEKGIKTKHVHALVAAAWLGPRPSDEHEVRHLNSKRDDCRLENIDWATGVQNWGDRAALENGIHEQHHAAKITMEDAAAIRASTLSQRAIAKQFGIAQSSVWAIRANRIWVKAPPASGRNFALPEPPTLWVRESLWKHDMEGWRYTAGKAAVTLPVNHPSVGAMISWAHHQERNGVPSIHMPRWASRLTLVVTATKIERLRNISEADARTEGMRRQKLIVEGEEVDGWFGWNEHAASKSACRAFEVVWCGLHGIESWDANPDVVALTFTVHTQNIDVVARAA